MIHNVLEFSVPSIDPLIIFLVSGVFSMSGALSAGAINKLPEEDKPEFAHKRNGLMTIVMAGNLAAVALLFSMAYGFSNLDWWIPLLCMFITFPVVHLVILQPMLGELKTLFLSSIISAVSLVVLYLYW
ncbi:hypothetical protein ACMXYW_05320 [Neptuniibacter sp. QD48_55]|uniref:hypothetical protein n=1 Tax=Neptuniibacter sp. QD48_55 TaxID=3398212 RepID=UPI0039F47BE6